MTKDALLAVHGKRILLDTNIIMKIEDSTKDVRETLLQFASTNDVCICDTVLYELLRNLNAKRFRERHNLIRKAGLNCISEGTQAVQAMFERISWLYLSLLNKEPTNFLHRQQNDLWIIAAGLANGVRHFLTTDKSSDFLPAVFQTQIFALDGKQKLCLHTFNNAAATKAWAKLSAEEACTIKLSRNYLEEIRKQSLSLQNSYKV